MASGDSGLSNAKAEGIRIRHIVRAEVDAIRECIGIALQAFRRMAILSKFEVQWYSPPNGNLTVRRQMADVQPTRRSGCLGNNGGEVPMSPRRVFPAGIALCAI